MNKLKIGILGLRFGRHIIEKQIMTGPGQPYFELAAVCDLKHDLADEVAQKHGVRVYYSLADLLADPNVAVIGLFSGPAGRAKLLEQIVRAGKDVMTTKPLELDPDAALAVLWQAQEMGRIIHLNSPAPLLPADLQQIKEWHKSYGLGRPIAARWETWVRYNEKPDGSWYDDPNMCPAAPLLRLGIYGLNDVVHLLGEPQSVYVAQSRLFTGRPTADNAQLSIQFANGALANLFASFCVNDGLAYPDNLTVNFENGTIHRTESVGEEPKTKGLHLVMRGEQGAYTVASVALDPAACSGAYQWHNFYRAVRGEKLPGAITPDQAVASVRVLRAMIRSQESGRAESV